MSLKPISARDWTRERAAHLLNRAGFGGSPAEIDALHARGPTAAVAFLLDGTPDDPPLPDPAWANPVSGRSDDLLMDAPAMNMSRGRDDETRRERERVLRQREQARLLDLRAWWLHRMRHSQHPFAEKMTLFLHGHFATSYEKVRNAYAMFVQNQTFRRHATGHWGDLVKAVARDPAMLVYLDGIQNARAAPNENFAREVMELFTLGEGHYSEDDIREAARAFTGWQFNRRAFTMTFNEKRYDNGRKTFMGRAGAFSANDLVDIILEQPQAARWLAVKLWTFFAYENPEPDVIDDLAATLRRHRYELRPTLERLFSSRAFYGSRALRTQVKSPVQWLIGSLKALEAPLPDPRLTTQLLAQLGQNLFEPPNVKGWDGGVTWITASSLAQRYTAGSQLAAARSGERARKQLLKQRDDIIASARDLGLTITLPDLDTPWLAEPPDPLYDPKAIVFDDPIALITHDDVITRLAHRLYQTDPRDRDRELFHRHLEPLPADPEAWTRSHCTRALEALINTPVYQLT
jgi:uncharacterized protein (DUF1800 family)